MEDRWQRQLQAIEEKTQFFRRSTSQHSGSAGRTAALDASLTVGSSLAAHRSRGHAAMSSSSLHSTSGRLSPQNLTRSSNIVRIGSRIHGPTVEDAIHEFSKRTTDIMKVMHTVGSELAQVQHALGAGNGGAGRSSSPPPGGGAGAEAGDVSHELTSSGLEEELRHVESIQNCVLQVGNLIDLLIKTLGVDQLQKLSLFGKVSSANKGIGRILDSAKAIKGSLHSGAAERTRLLDEARQAQRQYDDAHGALAQAKEDLRLQREKSNEASAQQQLAQVSEDAEQRVLMLTRDLESYEAHLRDVNGRCQQLQQQLALVDSVAGQESERAARQLQSAQQQIARLNQELDECRDTELQSGESKTTLQRNLMSEISSILREVAHKKIQTADELSARDRTIAQLESAQQAAARHGMKETEASRLKYESELRLLRDELAAARHAHELSLVRLEYSSEAKGSTAQASAERKLLELEHHAAQLETEMAQYKTQARTAAELLKEHREADPIMELQATRDELQSARHRGELEAAQWAHRLEMAEAQRRQVEDGHSRLEATADRLRDELSAAQGEHQAASRATAEVRHEWAARVARLEQQLTEAARAERDMHLRATAAAEVADAHRASLAVIAHGNGRHSPSSSRRAARASVAGDDDGGSQSPSRGSRSPSPSARGAVSRSTSPHGGRGGGGAGGGAAVARGGRGGASAVALQQAASAVRHQSSITHHSSTSTHQQHAFTMADLATSTAAPPPSAMAGQRLDDGQSRRRRGLRVTIQTPTGPRVVEYDGGGGGGSGGVTAAGHVEQQQRYHPGNGDGGGGGGGGGSGGSHDDDDDEDDRSDDRSKGDEDDDDDDDDDEAAALVRQQAVAIRTLRAEHVELEK